jgi:hypothetical protein
LELELIGFLSVDAGVGARSALGHRRCDAFVLGEARLL